MMALKNPAINLKKKQPKEKPVKIPQTPQTRNPAARRVLATQPTILRSLESKWRIVKTLAPMLTLSELPSQIKMMSTYSMKLDNQSDMEACQCNC